MRYYWSCTDFRCSALHMLIVASLTLSPLGLSQAFAECIFFDLVGSADKITYFVHARVIQTSTEDTLTDCITKEGNDPNSGCKYSFEVSVLDIFKGTFEPRKLRFEYPFWIGCPGVETFSVGEEHVFAIQSIDVSGKASLVHHSCGSHGIPMSETERVAELMKKLKEAG